MLQRVTSIFSKALPLYPGLHLPRAITRQTSSWQHVLNWKLKPPEDQFFMGYVVEGYEREAIAKVLNATFRLPWKGCPLRPFLAKYRLYHRDDMADALAAAYGQHKRGGNPEMSPEMSPPIIFLDIDGVMIAYPEGEHTTPTFTLRCVAALKSVLAAAPSAKVVFSTTWRLPNHVNRLHQQWLEHGFPESLAIDGTPDLRDDLSVRRRHSRGLEIQRWLEANPSATRWVVIDDDRMAIEEILDNDRCVFTDPARGMTVTDAEKAMAILMNVPHAFLNAPSRSVTE